MHEWRGCMGRTVCKAMPPTIKAFSEPERALVRNALHALLNHLSAVAGSLTNLNAPVAVPPELDRLIQDAVELEREIVQGSKDLPFAFTDAKLAILRAGLALHRRAVAERVEITQRRLATPEQIASVKQMVEPLDTILDSPPLDEVNPHPLPRLGSYFTAHGRQGLAGKLELTTEETDPKHHILLSPSLIATDTVAYRKDCEDRRLPFAVVYADLDDFKDFNTAKGEVYVDRFVLPPILNALEVTCYSHGRVYQHGGDEFLLLLPNAPQPLALMVATQVARAVADVRLDGVPHQPRLSIGVWITHPESHLTATELVDRAAAAKRHSKDLGKNRITIRVERASKYVETLHEVTP